MNLAESRSLPSSLPAELSSANPHPRIQTETRFKGNPLAIVLIPHGQDPATETLQTLAHEFNLSETVFLYLPSPTNPDPSPTPSWRARIFTTASELPFAGHPAIGTACYALRTLSPAPSGTLHLPAGPVPISLTPSGAAARASVPHALHLHTETPFSLADVEALQPALRAHRVRAIDVVSPVRGMNFACVELEGLEALGAVGCNGVKPAVRLDREWDVGFVGALFYVVLGVEDVEGGGRRVQVRTRMIEGAFEDAATGSAACALAGFLALKGGVRRVEFEVVQGVEMGRRSEIGVVVGLTEGLDGLESLELSGSAVRVMEGKVVVE